MKKSLLVGLGIATLALGGVAAGSVSLRFNHEVLETEAAAGDRTSTHQLVGDALAIGWKNDVNVNWQFVEQANGTFQWSGYFGEGIFRVIKPGDKDDWHTNVVGGDELGDGGLDGKFIDNNDGDNNIRCVTPGYYTATLDSKKSAISFATATPVFSMIGSFDGHEWNYDVDFEVNTATTTATLADITLAKGDTFKVRAFHQWAQSYDWSSASSHISVTDAWSRGEACFGDSSGNIAVLHDGTYTLSLNYSTGALSITGARAEHDTETNFRIFISDDGGSSYTPTEMPLKAESTTEYVITRDFTVGERFYFRFGSDYYHYSDIKEACTLKGTQFVANGQNTEALYSGNYTIYFETKSGSGWGAWLQYNSVSSGQIRANVISYAMYFNGEVGGACHLDGSTVVSELQTAWTNVKTRFDNAPADDVRTAIKSATSEDENAYVSEFVGKYEKVYYLRGASLGDQGGDFLDKSITPKASNNAISMMSNGSNNSVIAIAIVLSTIAAAGIGSFFYFRKRRHN